MKLKLKPKQNDNHHHRAGKEKIGRMNESEFSFRLR